LSVADDDDNIYRGTHATLDAEAREHAATRELGHWRYRTLTSILLVFVVGGIAVALLAIDLATDVQRRIDSGVAFPRVSTVVGIVAWLAVIYLGRVVARAIVRARTAAAVARIAARYDIPPDGLAATARAANGLD
jgi:hypothetical protein